jgi:DNA polymerase-3 subunit epsilon
VTGVVDGFAATPPAAPGAARQGSFDDLGTPLCEVTFVVLDLETTGGSPYECEITEIGAVKLRGGECVGRFETLVNPGTPIPPLITVLTGITETMVVAAPRIGEVLPAFLEFLGGAVVVGHNVRFDVGFLDAACARQGYARLSQRRVDTIAMARRLVRDEVPNLRLGTLARHLRVPTEPIHRAMADAQATAEVFHALLERAATFGVLGLDDLLALPTMRAHPSASKLSLTSRLPRAPGVYVFRDRNGRALYVGKATNLRARVRSYFAGDDRRKVPQMLREAVAIDHIVCADAFEAAVREVRLVQALQPRFNRQLKAWRQYSYLKLTNERFPRLTVARVARADGALYLGPFASSNTAHLVREAIETAIPLRRCAARLGRAFVAREGDAPCVPAQLGVATCPCRGEIDDDRYGELVALARRGLTTEPEILLGPLEARMRRLAGEQRFEEAAATRDRAAALARALERRRRIDALRGAARVVVTTRSGDVELRHGRLVLASGPGAGPAELDAPDVALPPGRDEVDELLVVARHLDAEAKRLRLAVVDGVFATARVPVPSYEPVVRERQLSRRR